MAQLKTTVISGDIAGSSYVIDNSLEKSEWVKLSHCICNDTEISDCKGTGLPWLHVRTPLGTDNADGVGWNPYIIEVVGYHTYSAECFHDFKAVVNTNGYSQTRDPVNGNAFYGSQVRVNNTGTGPLQSASSPYIYESNETYGGTNRLCFAVRKVSCCCTGILWVRFWKNGQMSRTYTWGTFHADYDTDGVSPIKYW